jgi:UDPglucose--hexose-1-phosphate uridylyltransferase
MERTSFADVCILLMSSPAQRPHRRRNALTGEWLLVSPHRAQRPWQGRREPEAANIRPAYDPQCYLCAGNVRANGERNPSYDSTFVFVNDYAALLSDEGPEEMLSDPLFHGEAVRGTCRVICFSPRHDLTLARMPAADIRRVVETWAEQSVELGREWRWVQVFENKGDVMGCSNPHPHGQIWASNQLPNEIAKEDREQRRYFDENGVPLLIDYARRELETGERIVLENEHWLAVVPYWAVWPFEILLLPKKRRVARLPDLHDVERDALSEILRRLLTRYDNLFETSFPYSMGWHGAPFSEDSSATDCDEHPHWQLHAHFYPPLLRSATVKKFMVGYEMLAEPQRDLTPEAASTRLREVSEIHYATLDS